MTIKKLKTSNTKDITLLTLSSIIYIISIIYGMTLMINNIDTSQSLLIILESILGLCIPLIYLIFYKCFHIKISFILKLAIFIFSFMGIILGESMHFYYTIAYWDKILHTISGLLITWVGYSLCYYFIKDTNINNKIIISIIVSIIFSLAISVLWEFYEFTVDSLFGLNMQKTIPTNELFNGGSSSISLIGNDKEIAAFYRESFGYKYALMDTMTDLLLNALGTIITVIIFFILNKINIIDSINLTFKKVTTYDL